MQKSRMTSMLLAAAALSASSMSALSREPTRTNANPPRPRRPHVHKLPDNASAEIRAWNAEVDAKRAQKRGRK